MATVMLQTADDHIYKEMLEVTSVVNKRFCERAGVEYISFVGLMRGCHPWHATLNRVDLLYEMLERDFEGWVIYLDADAWVQDQDFDLNKYLNDKINFAGIFVQSGATPRTWDVNAGVFGINLGFQHGKSIVREWRARLDRNWPLICDDENWPAGGPDDQSILHSILNDERLEPHIFLESKDVMNSNYARFIRQLLRSESSSFEQRLARIRETIANANANA